MKLRNLFAFVLVSAMAFVACEQEQDLGTPNLTLSASEVVLPQEGGDTTLTLTATRDWMVELDTAATKWLVVDPSSGVASASEQTVTVSALANDGYDRETSVKFTIGMQSKYLTVKQAGSNGSADELVVYSNDMDNGKVEKVNDKWPYPDQSDAWRNEKGTGVQNVTYSSNGVSVRSVSSTNNIWFPAKGGSYLSIQNIALNSTSSLQLTFDAVHGSPNGYKKSFSTSVFKVFVSKDAQKWVELPYELTENAENEFDTASAEFTVDGVDALSITFQFLGAEDGYRLTDINLLAYEGDDAVAVDFSKAEAKDFGAGSTGGGNTGGDNTGGSTQTWPTDVYTKVSQVTSGKKYVIFAEGIVAKPIEASRIYGYLYENSVTLDSEGKITTSDEYGFVFTAVEGGYTIMQSDGRFLYVADDNFKNFNVSKEPTSGHVWKVEAQSDGTFKITNVLAPKWIQFSSGYNSYGAYRETQDASFLPCLYEGTKDLTVQEGDNTGGDNTGGGNTGGGNTGGDVEIEIPAGAATISFSDVANRTTFSTSQQVWEQNGIKVVNDKGASTSNVADYSNPARFYKSSKLTVECSGMTKIWFACNNESYAKALKESITTGTVAIDGKTVQVDLTAAADSYVVETLSAQVRMDSITVYTE